MYCCSLEKETGFENSQSYIYPLVEIFKIQYNPTPFAEYKLQILKIGKQNFD